MKYFTINLATGAIIDVSNKRPDPQKQADAWQYEVQIIRGEIIGSAKPQRDKEEGASN